MVMEKLLRDAVHILKKAGSDTARLDAELLLAHVISGQRVDIYLRFGSTLSAEQVSRFMELIARRARHEPVAYIVGHTEFYGYRFAVSPDVLIPREETELLVDHALKKMADLATAHQGIPRVLDIGTGSGCIAAALAKKCKSFVVAWENSPSALALAQQNCAALGAAVTVELRDIFVEASWCISQPYDLIVSNPPYIAFGEKSSLPSSVINYEPPVALFGGADGLEHYRCISRNSPRILQNGGWVILEIGYRQGAEVKSILANDGWRCIELFRDLNGSDRVVVAQAG